MSYTLEFLAEANAELECISGDYEARAAGLGASFRNAVESICAAIVQNPMLWRERPGGFRRVNVAGFPYYVAFFLEDETAIIAAVAHAARDPDYWFGRLR